MAFKGTRNGTKTFARKVEPEWSPPDFEGQKKTRIGASVVEQFVSGHNASDVLRELVQNEFDGGGDRLDVDFGQDGLQVSGNGKGVTREGWKRLSVIVGTGRVVGDGQGERVEAKSNGIGSKNFGLRSLFLFGDEIYVRSGGDVAILALRTMETGKVKDPGYWGGSGVRIRVAFRTEPFEMLDPFTLEREGSAFEAMAGGMLATLVKLALPGTKQGLRAVRLHSTRLGRTLEWTQKAESLRSKAKGVAVTRRVGRLTDTASGGGRQDFVEMEFSTAIELPARFKDRPHPAYFKDKKGHIRIGVSLPIARNRIDRTHPGHFHYPLQAPGARTGCLMSVSAPFELDADRSQLTDFEWNDWLLKEAASFAVRLLAQDWLERFGVSILHAFVPRDVATPPTFIDTVGELLSNEACWPTMATGKDRLAKASLTMVPEEPLLDGFLDTTRQLDRAITADDALRTLALSAGASRFTISALVRLRCAGPDAKHLQTKLKPDEGNWHFPGYEVALANPSRQVLMAERLSALKGLSPQNRADLRETRSTLTASGALRPAKELVLVPPEIWEVCPEPMESRLHPDLVPHRAISASATEFDEQTWIIDAADRAAAGTIENKERAALLTRILDESAHLGRKALQAIRASPVVKDQRGRWVAPERMAMLKGASGRLLSPVIHAPSRDLVRSKTLIERLRIRSKLDAGDLIAFAQRMTERPAAAPEFEKLLLDNVQLLTRRVVDDLSSIPFLPTRAGTLAAPSVLHLDNETNRMVIRDEGVIVGGNNEVLYRKLGVAEFASVDTLIAIVEECRERGAAPERPELLYPAIIQSLKRERRPRDEFQFDPIVWWRDGFHRPADVMVGSAIPRILDRALPVARRLDEPAVSFLALGARTETTDDDWAKFFRAICGEWDGSPIPATDRKVLAEAYMIRGTSGLPPGIDDLECLLTRDGYLYSLDELRDGMLAENDFRPLADAVENAESELGIVDVNDKTGSFFHKLRLKPLSSLAGTGSPVFGDAARAPIWCKPHHETDLLRLMQRPLFVRAVHAVAWRRRFALERNVLVSVEDLAVRLGEIRRIAFFDVISREYVVHDVRASVDIEAAAKDGVIGLVAPRTKLDFQQLVGQALADLVGAPNAESARALSSDLLPLLLCRTNEDMLVWLERMGIDHAAWHKNDEPELDLYDDALETAGEEAVRQVMNAIAASNQHDAPPSFPPQPPTIPTAEAPPPLVPAPLPLPPIDEVTLSISEASNATIEQRPSFSAGSYGYGGWNPRTGTEVDRDQEYGRRGEELVYRMELERVRLAGHPEPEKMVIWTSLTQPGADHDICSIDDKGNPRWIEVKSTTGDDGRFEWSKKEFEKAIRERERYELWRVYRVASDRPIAKCFSNPGKLIGASRLLLELAALRASVEGIP